MASNAAPQKGGFLDRYMERLLTRKETLLKERAEQMVEVGAQHLVKGELEKAQECGRKALSLHEDPAGGYALLAQALMPGADYLTVLASIHAHMKPESYVEIGVCNGNSFSLAGPDTRTVGIDPVPTIGMTIPSRAKLFPTTSDDFFASYDLLKELGTSRLALAFIDGLHIFEQTLRDFINVERYADKNTVVFFHDCLPITPTVASRERRTNFWCGDVWKATACLIKYRPDLTIRLIPTFPSGLAFVTNLDPTSTVLSDGFDRIVAEYREKDLDYRYLETDRLRSMPGLVPNEWEAIARLLA